MTDVPAVPTTIAGVDGAIVDDATTLPSVAAAVGFDCTVDCIPEATMDGCLDGACIPQAVAGAGGIATGYAPGYAVSGAGSALPFTGIEDVLAPLLLALVVVLGGVVAWRWAQLQEAVAQAARRVRPSIDEKRRSGYGSAARGLEIEQRARAVFMPKVA